MARACKKCGYVTQEKDTSRCVLCKTPFTDAAKILTRLSESANEPQVATKTALTTLRSTTVRSKTVERVIAALTLLQGVIGVGGGLLLTLLFLSSELDLKIAGLVLLALVTRGFCGIAGAILLWQANRLGYYCTFICWGYLVIAAVIAVFQFQSLDFAQPDNLRHLGSTIGKLLFGLPILMYVGRAIALDSNAK